MKSQIKKLLKELVKINSAYPNESRLGSFIESLLKKEGYPIITETIGRNRQNIMVEKGVGGKSILLYSHLDTIGVVDGWKSNPLDLKISGDSAFGLGAWDMKGGMAVNILAFLAFKPKNIKLKLAFCVDEENISMGGYALSKSDFLKDVECIISPEPAFFHGNQGIVIGRPGRAVYTITVSGKPKHYAFYNAGEDISLFSFQLVNTLKQINRKTKNKTQFVFVRSISSKTLGMSTPQSIVIELDSSIIPPTTHSMILEKIKKDARKINKEYNNYFEVDVSFLQRETPFLESYEISKNDKFLRAMSRSIRSVTGKKAVGYFRSSIADENIFGSMGKTVLGVGAAGGNAHSYQEWVSLSSLEKLYNILSEFLIKVDNDL